MRRNMLTAGVMACGLGMFGAAPVSAAQMPATLASMAVGWAGLWDRALDRMTIPLDPWSASDRSSGSLRQS
jgi:hypothetical protein